MGFVLVGIPEEWFEGCELPQLLSNPVIGALQEVKTTQSADHQLVYPFLSLQTSVGAGRTLTMAASTSEQEYLLSDTSGDDDYVDAEEYQSVGGWCY